MPPPARPFSVWDPASTLVRRELRLIAVVLAVWALGSFGFIVLLWAVGTKGPPVLPLDQGLWDERFKIERSSLPGESWLTRAQVMGFPLHWFWVGVVLLALFIGLAIFFNLRVDGLRRGEAAETGDAAAAGQVTRPS